MGRPAGVKNRAGTEGMRVGGREGGTEGGTDGRRDGGTEGRRETCEAAAAAGGTLDSTPTTMPQA